MIWIAVLIWMMSAPSVVGAVAVELKGSPASMERQNRVAMDAGFAFATTVEDIEAMVEEGTLVILRGNEHYDVLDGLVADAAVPEMKLFIERLAEQYFEATGEKLVVTSLTRPTSMQPPNSHSLSVHPTGAAVDLRVSQRAESRGWLESALLGMEQRGLLDVTREHRPPHYHVALFPDPYIDYLEGLIGAEEVARALGQLEEVEEEAAEVEMVTAVMVIGEEEAKERRSIWRWLKSLFFA